jgi:hypothetical protein
MMNRRNAKILVLGAMLVLALPVVASAQMSRVEGMAVQGDYIKDWSAIFTYTNQVANVGNLVYGELGNVNSPPTTFDRSVGAVIGNLWDGRLGTWAIHLREQTPQLGQGDASSHPAPGVDGGDPNVNTDESFDIMWGKKFGTTSFGARLNRSSGALEIDGPSPFGKIEYDFSQFNPNFGRNVLGIGAGIGFEMTPTTNIEASILYQRRKYSLKDTTGTLVAEDGGPTTYQFAARAMWQWQPNIMVVPVFKWYSYDLSTSVTGAVTSPPFPAGTPLVNGTNSLKGWQVGAAGNWTLGANDLFVLGATFARNTLDLSDPNVSFTETETYAPQLFAALETHVNSWLTVRFGANKGAWYSIEDKDKTVPTTVKFKGSDFNMSLGSGVKVGNLQLDAVLNSAFPNNLPFFISGTATNNMFTKVTATYPW